MKKAVTLSVFLTCVFLLPSSAQTKERMIYSEPDSFKTEIANVEPIEEKAGVWNDFSSEKYGFLITFPALQKNVSVENENKFASFEAQTRKAHYGLTVKNLLVGLNNNQLEKLFDEIVKKTEDETTKLVAERDVCLNGFLGRELIYEEADRIVFGRFYILESKLFMLTVSVAKKDYDKSFDKWAFKFFDSFGVKSNTKMDA